jgi:uncharacterized protein (DUF362 family)
MKINRRMFLYLLGTLASSFGLEESFGGIKVFLKTPKEERPPRLRENHFKENGKSLVSVVGGKDVKAMVREAVSRIGGFEKLGIRGKTVLVKPNVVAGRSNPTTTNPEVIQTTVSLLYEAGASRVYVGDMSALFRLSTKENMEKTGIAKAARDAGAQVLYFEDHEWIRVKFPAGKYIKEVYVSEWIFNADRVINLPVIKTHRSAQYSICLKNFVGATHFRQRPYFVNRRHWEEVVSEINLAYTPDLNIVDGTTIMVEGGPWRGTEKQTNLIIASGDRVAADVVGLALIKSFGLWRAAPQSVWQARQVKRAVELGLGAAAKDKIKLVSASIGEDKKFENLLAKIDLS